jgi:hypothetical protein
VGRAFAYPVRVSIPLHGVRWTAGASQQHLLFRYFETVRLRYLEEPGLISFITETGIGPILPRHPAS